MYVRFGQRSLTRFARMAAKGLDTLGGMQTFTAFAKISVHPTKKRTFSLAILCDRGKGRQGA